MMSPKHNFTEMSLYELKCYVLANRDDREAWQEFTSRPRPNAIHFDNDMSLSEQEETLREILESDRVNHKA